MNNMKDALTAAGVTRTYEPPIWVDVDIIDPTNDNVLHTVRYNVCDEVQRRAVGSRIGECLRQGLVVLSVPVSAQ